MYLSSICYEQLLIFYLTLVLLHCVILKSIYKQCDLNIFILQRMLETKRDKLVEQLEEAKKLKESIDKRSVSVSSILYKYLNTEEYADYDHFINMKAKLIMDTKEIADKIKLGEEQLAALKDTLFIGD